MNNWVWQKANELAGKVTASHAAEKVSTPGLVQDPVCHMTVHPQMAQHRANFEGAVYYFSNAHCKSSFEKNPRMYLSMEAQA